MLDKPGSVFSAALVLFSIVMMPQVTSAQLIYSNLGPGDSYANDIGYTISGSTSLPGSFSSAMPFQVLGPSLALSTIELPVSIQLGANELQVTLLTSGLFGLPGAALETWHFSSVMGPFGSNNPLIVAVSASHPLLASGNTYWVSATVTDESLWGAWNFNSTGAIGLFAYSTNNGATWDPNSYTLGAMRITGAPASAPEGQSIILLVAGCIPIGCAVFRRRGSRYSLDLVTPVGPNMDID